MLEWLVADQVPFALVYTKCDRVNRSEPQRKLAELAKRLPWREDVEVFVTSSKDNVGIVGLRKWASRVLHAVSARAQA
jgi:GTP-binding protein EngB required for normal cell division